MASVKSLQVIFVLLLLCFCLVNGQQGNSEQHGSVLEDYIKSEVKRQVELIREDVIKAEVEKQVKVELFKLVKEKEENHLMKATESKYK